MAGEEAEPDRRRGDGEEAEPDRRRGDGEEAEPGRRRGDAQEAAPGRRVANPAAASCLVEVRTRPGRRASSRCESGLGVVRRRSALGGGRWVSTSWGSERGGG